MKVNSTLDELKSDLIFQIQNSIENDDQNLAAILKESSNLSFPTGKNEEWKYSPFSPHKGIAFDLKTKISTDGLPSENPFGEDVWHLVFFDGQYVPSASREPTLSGVQVKSGASLADFQRPYEKTLFGELNKATAAKVGCTILISDGVVVEKPILLHHIFSNSDKGTWVQPRIQISVGKGSQVSFIEWWQVPNSGFLVSNSVIEISQWPDSMVWLTNIENGTNGFSQIHQTRVNLEERAYFQHLVVTLGEGFIRNNLEIQVSGTQADAHMYGLCLGNHRLHVDNHTFVNHKEENTTSNQLYKTIMASKSTAVFNGKILVDQKAQKTNAYQSSKNILLSPDAKVYAKPQLEIFADDVKCSHGATIGQLDEEPIFYLRSRGLDEKAARKMLIQAFASEIIGKEKFEPLRSNLQDLLSGSL